MKHLPALMVKSKKQESFPLRESDKHVIFVKDFSIEKSIEFAKEFNDLNSDHEIDVITIIISSYGGSVNALLSMLDVISTAIKPVATIVTGPAMSCGSILLAAGTPGFRFAAKQSEILIHEISSGAMGTNTELKNTSKNVDRLNTKIFGLLGSFTGKSAKFFLDKLKASGNVDWYLSAKQAKQLGLVDHIGVPLLTERE